MIAAELNNHHLPVVFMITFLVYDRNNEILELVENCQNCTIRLRILDLDNNEPTFVNYEDRPYPIMISEGASGYALLPLVTDGDEGVNSSQNYILHSIIPFVGNIFTLDVRRTTDHFIVREVHLVQNGSLDREEQSSYFLEMRATEGNLDPQSATLNINVTVLDVCDGAPMFPSSRLYAIIEENSPSGSTVLPGITATDMDSLDVGKIRYHINLVCSKQYEDSTCLPQLNSPFELDRISGNLTIITGDIDREEYAEYELTVVAQDSCKSETTATVVVTIGNLNDNPPVLLP